MASTHQQRSSSFTPGAEFEKHFEMGALLGKGGFGSVYSCRDKRTGDVVACKVLSKEHVRSTLGVETSKEVGIMQELAEHKGVVQLVGAVEDDRHHYVVMEYCTGRTLLEVLKSHGSMPEQGARTILGQVAAALAFCHSKRVLHLDIKPENIFFLQEAADALYGGSSILDSLNVRARLADFGMATVLKPGKKVRGDVGSPHFKAPEIVAGKKFGLEVDVWSLGVVLCVMLTGTVPFLGSSNHDSEGLKTAILSGRVNFNSARWWGVSEEAKDLVSKMLEVDPTKRITAQQILQHPWLSPAPQGPAFEEEILPVYAKDTAIRSRRLSGTSARLGQSLTPSYTVSKAPRMKALKPQPIKMCKLQTPKVPSLAAARTATIGSMPAARFALV